MKTGLPNWRHLTESKKLAFIFNPGEKVEYSGEGFEYVRRSIEAKFNTPFEDIIQRLLFDKQGMDNISFSWSGKSDPGKYAENYDAKGEQYKTYIYHEGMAAGNILSTVDDYLKFGVHVLEGAGLSNTMYAEMTTPTSSLYKDLVMYGFGWMNVKLPSDEKMIYHDGRDPGVRTFFQLYPESKQGVVILTNGDDGDKLYYDLLKEISPKTKEFVETYVATRKMAMEEMKAKKEN